MVSRDLDGERQHSHRLTNFDLLVLGSPVYYWAPSRPVQGYLERVGDLR
jgi:multimeric flavodoxin WrbA